MRGGIDHLVVVVVYADSLAQCPTLDCLQTLDAGQRERMHLYVYINGRVDLRPELQSRFGGGFGRVSLAYDGRNRGIVYAYRQAILEAGPGVQWITLLDQDSRFDARLFAWREGEDLAPDPLVVALAPVVRDARGGRQVSPFRVFLGRALPFSAPRGFPVCINSMTTFRAAFLVRLAPSFPVGFFLDAFDVWLFHQMYRQGVGLRIMADQIVEQALSLSDAPPDEVFWAREVMALINSTKISPAFLPLAAARFSWRLVRVSWREKTLRYLHLMQNYRQYRHLIRELSL